MSENVAWPTRGLATGSENDHIALYVRLSRVFRQRILSREWPRGSQLPTVVELCKEHGVAAITVRQALKLLAEDGWIVATRGKGTFVTDARDSVHEHSLRNVNVSDPLAIGPAQRIKILKRERGASLPPDLSTGVGQEPYAHIKKLHFHQGTPFSLADVYVTEMAADRFPSGAERTTKISRLFREFANIPIENERQIFTVTYADQRAAALLKYSLGGVLVCMRSWWFDANGKVVFAGTFYYRGDMFVLERTGPHQAMPLLPLVDSGPEVVAKLARARKRKAAGNARSI